MSEEEQEAATGETPETAAEASAPETIPAYNPEDELIPIEDFLKVKLRVAEVLEASAHPNADKLMVLKVRLGERVKQICAGIREHYQAEDLVGKRIVVVDNLKPAKLRGIESQGMLLAASAGDEVVLLTTDKPNVPSGSGIR
ncbi:MAG: methionine--tRNA ligase subunit beta [Planctomycetes bacterium]|nr:methionine--tRNA ligase subunit beta [Planctomycetota bacterium]